MAASVKARDVDSRGWGANPHAHPAHASLAQAAAPSSTSSPTSEAASPGSGTASRSSTLPGREESGVLGSESSDFQLGTAWPESQPLQQAPAGCAQQAAEELNPSSSIGSQDLAALPSPTESGGSTQGFPTAAALPPLSAGVPGQVAYLSAEQYAAEVTLGRLLGAGGAGSVYEAVWRGRRVACKVIHPSSQDKPQARQRHQR